MHWSLTFLPVGVLLLLATTLLVYIVYPPKVRTCPEVPDWASQELRALGPLSGHEVVLLGLIALGLWIFGGSLTDPTTAALLVIGLLVVTRTIDWADVLAHKPAFNTLIWFGSVEC